MTYQTAYKLLVAAYKSAKGIMPEGLDLLKIKQKARQKVIDAKKVIEVNFDKGNNWMKAKPQSTKGKGKVAETEAEMIVRMNRQNKESVARLKEKKEKSLGEKLRDYDGDPDAMASGGKVKKPFRSKVVDFLGGPAVVGAELGLSGLLEVYNILGMPLMKDGGKVRKKRKHDDNIDDEDIGEGKSKERFLRVMPEVDGISRSDGIMELATGGMTNISDTYDNNPTLQSQYPNKQDYLDMFAQQTTTTTPQTNTTTQATTSTIAPINPIKPIIPIPQYSNDSGGITTIQPRAPKEDLTFRERMANLNLQMGVPVKEEEVSFFDKIKGLSPTYQFMKAGKQLKDRGQQAIEDFFEKQRKAKAARELENRIRSQSPSGSMDYGPSGYEGMSDAASDQERSEGGRGSRG